MLERIFQLSRHGTSVRTEVLAGVTTFLTMAYIIVVQPVILSGRAFNLETGMDFGAVMAATCLVSAGATAIMALYARLPIALAPGMGENAFFVLSCLPAAAAVVDANVAAGTWQPGEVAPWQVGLGVIFLSGIVFLLISVAGVRELLIDAVSPSMRAGITVGIGLFIAFIGLKNARLVLPSTGTLVTMNPQLASPDLIVFFLGLLVTAALIARRVRGAIVWGIAAATLAAVAMKLSLPYWPTWLTEMPLVSQSELVKQFRLAEGVVALPPSVAPTFFQMNRVGAIAWQMVPFIFIFLFMDLFDTLGTLLGLSEQAGLMEGNKLPRARQALMSDAVGTAAGAAMGTTTVVAFIESAAGIEEGGRTGLTALVVAVLFLLALFFGPIVEMIGSYAVLTAPALVIVGSMMMRSATRIEWSNYAEALPAFLIVLGIPLTYSIGDGLALGFLSYPIIKLLAGQGRDVRWLMYVMALILAAYFVAVRSQVG